MSLIVVAGSNNDARFAVINFAVPGNPAQVLVRAPFLGGCMADCSGTLAAVANFNGSQVAIFDISNPASPVLKSTVVTGLAGISAVSFDGSHVLLGELNGTRLMFLDVSNPTAPSIRSTLNSTLGSISAVALQGNLAVASGPNDAYFVVVNYANPAAPVLNKFVPGTGGVFFNGSVTCDLDGTHAAVADFSGTVYLFDVSSGSPHLLGKYRSHQAGVFSISISGSLVAAASTNDTTFTLVNFSNVANPSGTDTAAGLGGGTVIKLSGASLAAGAVNGTGVKLFSVAGTSATALGTDNTSLGSIATMGITDITPVVPKPAIAASPTSLSFGAVKVHTTSPMQAVTLENNGTAPLQITGLKTNIAQYAVTPGGNLSLNAGASVAVHLTFTPSAVQSYAGQLTMSTNDPVHPLFAIPLSGSGK